MDIAPWLTFMVDTSDIGSAVDVTGMAMMSLLEFKCVLLNRLCAESDNVPDMRGSRPDGPGVTGNPCAVDETRRRDGTSNVRIPVGDEPDKLLSPGLIATDATEMPRPMPSTVSSPFATDVDRGCWVNGGEKPPSVSGKSRGDNRLRALRANAEIDCLGFTVNGRIEGATGSFSRGVKRFSRGVKCTS